MTVEPQVQRQQELEQGQGRGPFTYCSDQARIWMYSAWPETLNDAELRNELFCLAEGIAILESILAERAAAPSTSCRETSSALLGHWERCTEGKASTHQRLHLLGI